MVFRGRGKKRVKFEDVDNNVDFPRHCVENICSPLSTPLKTQKTCIGFVLDDELSFYRNHSVDRDCHVKIDKVCPSLETVISENSRSAYFPTGLTREECLCLAVNLTSSVLQLHGTPWLPETWCNKCIYFARPVDVEQPYVMISFGGSLSVHKNKTSFGINSYLVGLGIILLELSENRSLHDWLKDRNDNTLPETILDKFVLGRKWLADAVGRKKMSDQYASVVQLCLNSTFDPVPSSTELDDEGFRKAVYDQILLPLGREYVNVKEKLQILTERSGGDFLTEW